MRAALWLMGLFAAAVALALFAGDNEGTVTVFWPPHRVDVSVNLALLLLLALFVLLYLALRALSAMVQLPRQARRWRTQQRERAMHATLIDAAAQLAAVLFAAAFVILGPERLWAQFGPADLGDVDFASLRVDYADLIASVKMNAVFA